LAARAFFNVAGMAALCCASQSLAQPAADPFGWERSRVAMPGQEHYWATRLFKPPGVVGLHDVFLVEMFRAEKAFSMPLRGKPTTVYGVAHQRVYNCQSGAYRTINLYLLTSPDVLSPKAGQVKISLPEEDPEMRGTLKPGSSHRAFLDQRCSGDGR
jgi:hypothetical protein